MPASLQSSSRAASSRSLEAQLKDPSTVSVLDQRRNSTHSEQPTNGPTAISAVKDQSTTVERGSHTRPNALWKRHEDELLFDLRQRGVPWKKISATLQRPVAACYSRYYRHLDPFLADAIEGDAEDAESIKEAVEASQRILEANVHGAILKRAREDSHLPLPYDVQGPWTAADRDRLESLVAAQTPWSIIAKELQRNQHSCKEKWARIQRSQRETKRQSKRVRSEQWIRLFKEGFSPHHRDQLMRAVEKQLAAKGSFPISTVDPLGFLRMDNNHNQGQDAGHAFDSPDVTSESIDWDAISSSLNNKFPPTRLRSIYHELAATKLIWTPEEDERLIRAVVRLGPPELQPRIWSMIKEAFGDIIRTSDDYRSRWRELDMPPLDREWDLSEKVKFWRRWMEYQNGGSLLTTASVYSDDSTPATEDNPMDETTLAVSARPTTYEMWDQIAEGLEYRHARDCQLYFERTTARFPRDRDLFRYLTTELAKVYLKPRKVYWSADSSRLLVATVNSFLQKNKIVDWRYVTKTFNDDNERSLWSDKELELLKKGVGEYGHHWAKIRDQFLPHRSRQALRERYWRNQAKKTGRFSEKERSLLETAIETFGEGADWELIAGHVPGRTASQCRKSWNYSRTHHLQRQDEPWTDQDKELLKSAVARFGSKRWTLISEFVVGKTPDQCRNEWRKRLDPAVTKKGLWTSKELDVLMERVVNLMTREEEQEIRQVAEIAAMNGVSPGYVDQQLQQQKQPIFVDPMPRFKGKRKVDWKEVARGIEGRTPEECRVQFRCTRFTHPHSSRYCSLAPPSPLRMPAPTKKKVVNPEKEMRGKKPYNRGSPGGLKKKAYQAKPAKLDEGEVPEGAAALKKKLRDTLRLLSKNPKMPADVRLDHERRIEALKLQIAEKQVDQTEQKMATKYRMVKFFESKKADRKIKVFMRQHPDWESNEEEKKELESLKLDLAYVQHFPKTLKYIALYPTENADDPVVTKEREEIREKIRAGLESGEIAQFVKSAREEVKAKIVSKDTLSTEDAIKLTAEKINKGKKRTRDQLAESGDQENDPLSARAKATAAREAAKPKEEAVQEEESFFETVPKVVAASAGPDAASTEGLSKRKMKADKRAAKKVKVDESTPAPAVATAKESKKSQQQAQDNKKSQTAPAAASATEEGEVKKLGKWARKAIRAKSTFAAKEESPAAAAATGTATETVSTEEKTTGKENTSTSAVIEEAVAVPGSEKKPVEKKKAAEKKPATKASAKAQQAEKVAEKVAEKKVSEKKVAEKKVAEKVIEKKVAEKPKQTKEVKESKVASEPEVKVDGPRITTLKVNPDDNNVSDDEDDTPAAPVRKTVMIDHSLLKELPEVPKRRGGRNLNKFRK
ncbi:hypothetical protein KVV02_008191 [Mortierella alpina]|uniref:rRNA-processing protein EFG1 n=1 Tax=Mortierella alpina TaxID=64518 RepID=A0A9P8A060_MORAP|nr:hypothetical protein KVV02_008191 [Mortierella alpina]